ncbi:nicotinate (nicotinamide) nucleotide adenylyltransferase [Limnohabitans sp. B9-3]|uniref:nicotinate (nicotinamide) nucleotide adenylyltransferase n=1 Tax=Limnohabitans sp. B9-3 TaxID=1100707 RepID=UPI000C1EC833|nr:nicotinate (nicotinamide) nucleotide adenylyltransferase [Limnohabitans sp. B9-3]PIT74455.1 nicotinate (nicotinamide) nucleotide adenylyltransferase [Limnohabitans sp. B9-3]
MPDTDIVRLGVFGGAFDPPHLAHLALARRAVAQFALDRLLIIPTGQAWHKTRSLTAAPHRLAMTRLAFAELPQAWVDAREIERDGPTFTVDTLNDLQLEYPNAKLFLFIGADQARAFQTWHRWQEILQLATLVVAQRPLDDVGENRKTDAQWHNAVSPDVQILDMPSLPISATEIRSHLAHGSQTQVAPLHEWLSAPVQHYVDQHRLYRLDR